MQKPNTLNSELESLLDGFDGTFFFYSKSQQTKMSGLNEFVITKFFFLFLISSGTSRCFEQ